MANELTLSVNGTKQVVSAAPETPLLFVLRNELKLSGPRLEMGQHTPRCESNWRCYQFGAADLRPGTA